MREIAGESEAEMCRLVYGIFVIFAFPLFSSVRILSDDVRFVLDDLCECITHSIELVRLHPHSEGHVLGLFSCIRTDVNRSDNYVRETIVI